MADPQLVQLRLDLCGDGLVEQAIHTVDKIAWAFKDKPPVSCVAVGGRQIPNGIGNIYDHFEVNYLYPEQRSRVPRLPPDRRLLQRELRLHLGHERRPDHRTRSAARASKARPSGPSKARRTICTRREHDALFAAIRKGQPINDGERMATSTLLGIMGRMAAYTGQQVTWEQAMNSQERSSRRSSIGRAALQSVRWRAGHYKAGLTHALLRSRNR